MPLKGPLFNGSMPGPMAGEPYVFRTPADEARRLKGRQDDARTAWLRESPEGRALAARLALEAGMVRAPEQPAEPEPERLALLPRYEGGEEGWVAPMAAEGVAKAGSLFGRAYRGEPIREDEPMNFAMNVAGGSVIAGRRPKGSVGMGGLEEGPLARQPVELGPMADPLAAPLQPSDRPRIPWKEQTAAPAELTRKSVGQGERYLPGAPAHVTNVQQQTAIANDYLKGALRGVAGRDWYRKVQDAMRYSTGNLGGKREGAQDVQTAVLGDFSPRASIESNRLAQVRATVQHATGEPVAAGMGPRNKAAEESLRSERGEGTLKVDPFTRQMRGLEALRGVHDTRDLQAFGFPQGMSPSATNHRWMDMMMDRLVDRANEMKLGGFDDWTHDKLQAARWVAHKAEEEGVPVESLANAFGPVDEKLTANIYSEAIPSKELSDLVGMSDEAKAAYTQNFNDKLSTAEGQDALSLQMGLETPPGGGYGVGEWEGNLNPNIRNRVLVDPEKGGLDISAAGKTAVDFRAGLSGLLGGQADTAFSYVRPTGKKEMGPRNSVVVDLGRPATGADLTTYRTGLASKLPAHADPNHPGVIPNLRSDQSIEMTYPGGGPKWRRSVEDTIAELGGAARQGRNSGDLTLRPQTPTEAAPKPAPMMDRYKPSEWLTKLQNPTLRASVKEMLPQAAAKIEQIARDLPLTDTGRNVYLKTLELLKSGGLEAVEDAVKKGILPAVALAILFEGSSPAPRDPGALPGPGQSTPAGA